MRRMSKAVWTSSVKLTRNKPEMRSLGIIAARGSSKRLPNKCLLPLGDMPLVGHVCQSALAASFDRLVLSTESPEIAAAARKTGVEAPFERPAELAEDWATSTAILQHALDWVETTSGETFDIVVLIQATSPFLKTHSINECIAALKRSPSAHCAITMRETREAPQWMYSIDGEGFAENILQVTIDASSEHKQLLDKTYFPTGGAYAVRSSGLREHNLIVNDPIVPVIVEMQDAVDIDDELDLEMARFLLQHGA